MVEVVAVEGVVVVGEMGLQAEMARAGRIGRLVQQVPPVMCARILRPVLGHPLDP